MQQYAAVRAVAHPVLYPLDRGRLRAGAAVEPDDGPAVLLLYLYRNAFSYLKMGYAAAIALIMFLLTLGLTVFLFRWSRRWVYYAGSG